ncbi:hypothetical protein SAMN05660420_03399 [Desulfuromusa kysingii]|uniref:Uncharacterized protein n=1 Tax=Desulfuromusa kysingii TaxID=37625 RepID=A0A1H4EI85_9BACT|nr:hypothetical protein [Desulfuromusa kysingii]SEA84794.1 hypothetical protein SAMN05660420_03399 [Desulfuromusa kysingii]
MDAGVWEIFGTRYYTHGFGLLFVFPFAIWFFVASVLTLKGLVVERTFKWRGLALSACLIVVTLVAVFWDVYQIGQQATKLCNEKAGLHVYRTAEAEGVLGLFSIEHWSKYGFKFVEYEDVLKNKTRYFLEGGKPAHKKVNQFLSQYEYLITRKNLTSRIGIIKQEIKDRNANEVLGESNEFSIDGGWADMLFYNTTGFSYSPWICSGSNESQKIYPSELVKAVLKPEEILGT